MLSQSQGCRCIFIFRAIRLPRIQILIRIMYLLWPFSLPVWCFTFYAISDSIFTEPLSSCKVLEMRARTLCCVSGEPSRIEKGVRVRRGVVVLQRNSISIALWSVEVARSGSMTTCMYLNGGKSNNYFYGLTKMRIFSTFLRPRRCKNFLLKIFAPYLRNACNLYV